jgi:hypothetical protein
VQQHQRWPQPRQLVGCICPDQRGEHLQHRLGVCRCLQSLEPTRDRRWNPIREKAPRHQMRRPAYHSACLNDRPPVLHSLDRCAEMCAVAHGERMNPLRDAQGGVERNGAADRFAHKMCLRDASRIHHREQIVGQRVEREGRRPFDPGRGAVPTHVEAKNAVTIHQPLCPQLAACSNAMVQHHRLPGRHPRGRDVGELVIQGATLACQFGHGRFLSSSEKLRRADASNPVVETPPLRGNWRLPSSTSAAWLPVGATARLSD